MAGPEPITPSNEGTTNQNTTRDIIEGHMSALKELLKELNNRNLIKPMLLDFDDVQDVSDDEIHGDVSGATRMWLTLRYMMEGCSLKSLGRFVRIGKISENWTIKSKNRNRKSGRMANAGVVQEIWVSESNDIPNVPELMQISSFMSSHKCPELAKRFADNIPKTVDEMLKRVDDYLRSEEAFRNTELPRGENNRRRSEHKFAASVPERHAPYVSPQRPHQEFHRPKEILTLDSLSSTPQEILAMEHQLNLPQPAPLVGVPSKENLNRYCDYHNEKGHNTNDCFHLKRQLEIALESGKLNHLVKDVRQRGKVGQRSNGPQKAKVINMVQYHPPDRKRKTIMTDEEWINVPIIFPPVPARDLSKEALVVEAEVEGYLVRRMHIDEGASIEILFEQCFNMLHLSIWSKLVEMQTTVSGFSGEQVSRLEIYARRMLRDEQEMSEEQSMKFTVIPAPLLKTSSGFAPV
ncbi:hypothetical protein Tco_1287367 [Tanacetum coccineum]